MLKSRLYWSIFWLKAQICEMSINSGLAENLLGGGGAGERLLGTLYSPEAGCLKVTVLQTRVKAG